MGKLRIGKNNGKIENLKKIMEKLRIGKNNGKIENWKK
jgi:hypothetical protein